MLSAPVIGLRLIPAIAIALALWNIGPDARADGSGHCHPTVGARVIKKTREAVVIQRRDGRVYGCYFRSGRFTRVPADVPGYTLAGPYVAYSLQSFDPDGTEFLLLIVRDLRTGRDHHSPAIYTAPQYPDGEGPGAISDITLKRNGSVAWISCLASDPNRTRCYPPDPQAPYEVWRADRRGRKLLERSSTIRLHSLSRKASTITWRSDGMTRSAALR